MIHPLLRLVATHPQLLADHAEAYVGLVGDELGQTAAAWKRRALLGSVALFMVSIAVIFAGVAVMLWAVTPAASLQAPWVLFAVPGGAAVVAIICVVASRSQPEAAFAELKRQMAADLAMIRDVSAA